jgi:glycosyltransferase involved in cell wall biosynthesis
MELYSGGRRRILPPLLFGAGVLWHLARHGKRYDVVHTASFPYFSLLAAGALRRIRRYRLVVDWFEVWTRKYWRAYLGRPGSVGWAVQRLCIRIRQQAFSTSRLQAGRLRDEGFADEVEIIRPYTGPLEPGEPAAAEPLVVYAGRHIPEKRVPALLPAIAEARERAPELRYLILGDGPERDRVLALIEELALRDVVEAPGFVPAERVQHALRHAACLVLPSTREGYGLVVVEAAAHGTPSVVVAGPDNAAVELIDEGVNGFVAPSASPRDLADAILRVHEAGPGLRDSTRSWFARNARELAPENAIERVVAAYRGGAASAAS